MPTPRRPRPRPRPTVRRLIVLEARALAAEIRCDSLILRLKEKDVRIRELQGELEIARQDLAAKT